jgi:hypothetical protein
MFHLFFILQVWLSRCCICFYTYVASVLPGCCVYLQWFSSVFYVVLQVFQTHVSSVSWEFRRMFQTLHPYVLKVDRGSHKLQQLGRRRVGVDDGGGASCSPHDLVAQAPHGRAKRKHGEACWCRRGRSAGMHGNKV